MFHNKKFLFVESIFFILVVIFVFKIGWRDVSANFNSLTNLGTGHTKIDVSSDGSTIGFIPSSGGESAKISNNNGASITSQSATRNSWIDIYESGGKFVTVSDSNGDYIHYFDGWTWNPLNVGSGTYPSGPFTSISINDYGNTVIATKGDGWFDYVVGGGSWSNNYNGSFWTDSALSSDGNVVLMSSSNNGVYVNTNGNPAGISNVISGNFTKVAMNDSASQMLILSSTGDVLYSTNGFSWNNLPNISGVSGMDVANSGAIVVSQGSGEIRYTTNLGFSWITLDSRSLNWADVKINDEGTKVYAVIANDYPQTIDLIQGCTNPSAYNYNPSANIDNGSCYYTPGCTNPSAINYNPSADYDDGSCYYTPGCTDSAAVNYNPSADYDDGSCDYAPENSAPIVSGPLPSGIQAQGTVSVTLQVTTNENSTCKYGTIEGIDYNSISDTFNITGGTTHTQAITGLVANTSYIYYVRCNDGSLSSTEDTLISFSIPNNTTSSGSSGSGSFDMSIDAKCTLSDTTVKVGEKVGVVIEVKINNNSQSKNYDFSWIQELKGKDRTTAISFDKEGNYTPKARIKTKFIERIISCDTITVSNTYSNVEDDENIVTVTTQTISELRTKTLNLITDLYNQYFNIIQTDPTKTTKLNDLLNQIKEQFSLLEMTRLNPETSGVFTKDLEFGMQDPEVKLLQQFLNNSGYIVSEIGFGSIGNETEMFGFATRAALAKFQRDNNISPALGFFGSVTRSLVNSLLN